MSSPIGYTAVIAPVRETILSGAADLSFWRERLSVEALRPLDDGGRAVLLVSALESKFNGLPFREMSVAVVLEEGGVFLIGAFNSSRLLGFAERALFRTPYVHAPIDLSERLPAFIQLGDSGRPAFKARMGARAAAAGRREDVFEGPIYLPGDGQQPGEVFYARLEGQADIVPFDPARDEIRMEPESAAPVVRWLAESGFVATEWRLRGNATHSRSKTIRRP